MPRLYGATQKTLIATTCTKRLLRIQHLGFAVRGIDGFGDDKEYRRGMKWSLSNAS